MTLEETKGLFDKIAQTLQEKIPEGEEDKFAVAGAAADDPGRDKLFGLVPEALRAQAFTEAMALSDDEAYACVNRVSQRASLRSSMNVPTIAYFSHPYWKELFVKASQSPAAKAKKAG
jgi:hypothetical protein